MVRCFGVSAEVCAGGGAAIRDFEHFQFERDSDIIAALEGPVA